MNTCRRSFVVGSLALLLATAVIHSQTPPGRLSAGIQPTVFDVNGQRVGNVVGFTDVNGELFVPVVALTIDRTLIVLAVGHDRFIGYDLGSPPAVFFESPGCLGTPFVSGADFAPGLARGPSPYLFVSMNRVYVANPDNVASVPLFTPGSFLLTDTMEIPESLKSSDRACHSGADMDEYGFSKFFQTDPFPATFLGDLGEYFTAPFTVR